MSKKFESNRKEMGSIAGMLICFSVSVFIGACIGAACTHDPGQGGEVLSDSETFFLIVQYASNGSVIDYWRSLSVGRDSRGSFIHFESDGEKILLKGDVIVVKVKGLDALNKAVARYTRKESRDGN